MQQLHDLVAEHHLARGGGDILANDKAVGRLADGKLAFAPLDIGQKIVQPLDQIFAIGGDGGLQHIRIGEGEVGGGQGIGELAGIESDPAALFLIQPVQLSHHLLQGVGGQQIALLDEIEDLVVFPLLRLEAAIARGRLDHGGSLAAQHAAGGGFPQRHEAIPPFGLSLQYRLAVAAHGLGQRHHGARDIQRIDGPRILAPGHAGDEIHQQLLALHAHGEHVAGEGLGLETLGGGGR